MYFTTYSFSDWIKNVLDHFYFCNYPKYQEIPGVKELSSHLSCLCDSNNKLEYEDLSNRDFYVVFQKQ